MAITFPLSCVPTRPRNDSTLHRDPEDVASKSSQQSHRLRRAYHGLLREGILKRAEHYEFQRRLGRGGQGSVYLCRKQGADGFSRQVAVKVFSPEQYTSASRYERAMDHAAQMAGRVTALHNHSIIDVYHFFEHDGIRLMEMEWIDGFDLAHLLQPEMLTNAWDRLSERRWNELNEMVVTAGPLQPRLLPVGALCVARDVLLALSSLSEDGMVHGDVKPSNLMLNRAGQVKLIDLGAAFDEERPPARRLDTPNYAAPEVEEGLPGTSRSDLCSLGYMLVELLIGRRLHDDQSTDAERLSVKRRLRQEIPDLLPPEARSVAPLVKLCQGLVVVDPVRRLSHLDAQSLVGDAMFEVERRHPQRVNLLENALRWWTGVL